MRDHVRFVSDLFSPRRPEDEQVNPGRYGEELATWLIEQLRRTGASAAGPYEEDWGWLVELTWNGQRFSLPCGNMDFSRTEWLIWIQPHRGLLNRLLRRNHAEATAELALALHAILKSEPRISELEWFAVDPRLQGLQEHDHAAEPDNAPA